MVGRPGVLLGGLALVLYISFASSRPIVSNDLLDPRAAKQQEGGRAGALAARTSAGGEAANDLVAVDFYGESLCPDCQHMVLDVLQPIFESGVAELTHLRWVDAEVHLLINPASPTTLLSERLAGWAARSRLE